MLFGKKGERKRKASATGDFKRMKCCNEHFSTVNLPVSNTHLFHPIYVFA